METPPHTRVSKTPEAPRKIERSNARFGILYDDGDEDEMEKKISDQISTKVLETWKGDDKLVSRKLFATLSEEKIITEKDQKPRSDKSQ